LLLEDGHKQKLGGSRWSVRVDKRLKKWGAQKYHHPRIQVKRVRGEGRHAHPSAGSRAVHALKKEDKRK